MPTLQEIIENGHCLADAGTPRDGERRRLLRRFADDVRFRA